MEITMTRQCILVDLDAIQDTRLGTLARIDPTLPRLMGQRYWDRLSDDFETLTQGKVTNRSFQEAYKSRNTETLKQSIASGTVHYLGLCTRTLQSMGTGPEQIDDICVTVNLYPYTLSEGEQESLIEALRTFLALSTKIDVINKSVKELTPQYLNQNFDAYILYDFNEWDSHNRTNLIRNPMPEFTLMAPALFLPGKEPTLEEVTDEDGHVYDPFKVVQMALYEWVILEHFPPAMFSMLHPAYDFTKSS